MVYLGAFILSGLLCLIGQILISNTKIGILKLFISALVVGAIATFTGVIGPMIEFGFAGVIISVFDAGEALYGGFLAAFQGEATSIIVFGVMLLCIFLVAIMAGVIKKIERK